MCAARRSIGTTRGSRSRRPVSRILYAPAREARRSSIWTASRDTVHAAYPRVNRDGPPRGALTDALPAYLALLRMGFAVPRLLPGRAVGSYPTVSPLPVPAPAPAGSLRTEGSTRVIGGLFSVALSVASRRPAVSRHSALRSSDFPPLRLPPERRPPGRLEWLPRFMVHGILQSRPDRVRCSTRVEDHPRPADRSKIHVLLFRQEDHAAGFAEDDVLHLPDFRLPLRRHHGETGSARRGI